MTFASCHYSALGPMKNDHKEVIITVILTTWCQAHIFTMLLFDRLLLAVALAVVALPSCLGQPLPQLTSIVEEPGPEVLPYDPVIAQTGMMVAEECPLMPGTRSVPIYCSHCRFYQFILSTRSLTTSYPLLFNRLL